MRRFRVRRSALAYWTIAVVLAVTTGLFVGDLVRRAEEQAARFGDVRTVLVARRTIAAGAVLRPADVVEREMPMALLPAGPLAAAPFGKTVIVPLSRGEVVLAAKVAPEGLHGVAALLRPGERALAVPVGPGTPPLAMGDEVDVLATTQGDGTTTVVAHGGRVVGADERAVTVAVREADAPGVATALAAATVTLALAAP
jgi:Flp pilus assembly protein CpaB